MYPYLAATAAIALGVFLLRRMHSTARALAYLHSLRFFSVDYLLFGLVLGLFLPDAFHVQFDRVSGAVLMFCLGWTGLYFGCGLELRVHQRLVPTVILYNIIEPLTVFMIMVIAGLAVGLVHPLDRNVVTVIVFAAVFSTFSLLRRHGILHADEDATVHPLLQELVPVGNLVPVLLLAAATYVLAGPKSVHLFGQVFEGPVSFFTLQFIAGILAGMLLNMAVSGTKTPDDICIVLVAGTALTGGLAYSLSFSPLLVSTVAGAFLINASLKRVQVLSALNRVHLPVEKILMLVLGLLSVAILTSGEISWKIAVGAALVLFVFRTGVVYWLAMIWVKRFGEHRRRFTILWLGLGGQSVIAAAAAFELRLSIPQEPWMFIAFMLLVALNQLLVAGALPLVSGRRKHKPAAVNDV